GKQRRLELRGFADQHPAAAPRRSFNQYWEFAANQGAVTFQRNGLLKRNHLSQAAALLHLAHGIAELEGARMLAHRILEHERRVITNCAHQSERRLEILLVLAVKAHDDVG